MRRFFEIANQLEKASSDEERKRLIEVLREYGVYINKNLSIDPVYKMINQIYKNTSNKHYKYHFIKGGMVMLEHIKKIFEEGSDENKK